MPSQALQSVAMVQLRDAIEEVKSTFGPPLSILRFTLSLRPLRNQKDSNIAWIALPSDVNCWVSACRAVSDRIIGRETLYELAVSHIVHLRADLARILHSRSFQASGHVH